MNIQARHYWYLAFIFLGISLLGGLTGMLAYLLSGHSKFSGYFYIIRPIHVSAAIGWILTGAMAILYQFYFKDPNRLLMRLQFVLWLTAYIGIFGSFLRSDFQGREYWEYPPVWSLPLGLAWLIMVYEVIAEGMRTRPWAAWQWMWFTGALFFIYIFSEGYLWLFPSLRGKLISDIALQWKVNGSLVGSWNQLIYGFSVYIMASSGASDNSFNRQAKAVFLLGFANMCLNWSHHFYILPVPIWIKMTGYLISMTEWVLLIKMIRERYQGDRNESQATASPAGAFLKNAGHWIFLNLILALLISIPVINKFTHGTHITVAHAMGTTIGINTMILFAAAAESFHWKDSKMKLWVRMFNLGLGLLVLSLFAAGISKSIWQFRQEQVTFSEMMHSLKIWWIPAMLGGLLCAISLLRWNILIVKNHYDSTHNKP